MATEFNTGADASLNAAVKSRYEANANTNAFTDAEKTKLASAATVSSGAGVPASTPSALGDLYVDTANDAVYQATGTASSADWKITKEVIEFDAGGNPAAARPAHPTDKTVIWTNHGLVKPANAEAKDMFSVPEPVKVALSDETSDLTTGLKRTTRASFAFTLESVRAEVVTAPVGSVITFDIQKNGVTVFSTKLTIDDGEKTSVTATTPAVISVTSFADDDEITFHIDGIGSTTAGAGAKVTLYITRA